MLTSALDTVLLNICELAINLFCPDIILHLQGRHLDFKLGGFK
jgi:hypothetical protein